VRRIWSTAPPDSEAAALAREADVPPLLAALLRRRGISTAAQARAFLAPSVASLHDPLRLRGAEEAAERLAAAARAGRRIVVFGDYDVDGVTAAAQMRAALLRAGADAVAFLPHRFRDGYGLKPETVRRVLAEHSPAVLVTVDCGVTAAEGVACARQAGVEVIVTDHHVVPDDLPEGAVVVNPKQPGCEYPCKDLSAAGIALKIAEAVSRLAGGPLPLESFLRVACLGTIADLVPLADENRVIAATGLAALASPRAPGLRALLAECAVPAGSAPTSDEVAYRLAPRLNAAGRMDTAEVALSLLEERDAGRAADLARELSTRNAERQAVERRVVAEAREKILAEGDPERDAVLIAADAAWHRGVLGIAASRLAREYHRPVLLFGLEGDRAGGSGRSIPGVPLHGILKEISTHFLEFGGHDQAVGGTLPAERFDRFRAEARAHFAARVAAETLVPVERVDAELPVSEATPELASWLAKLEPHGNGNARPVFLARDAQARERRPAGEHGLRGVLREPGAPDLPFIAWRETAREVETLAGASAPIEVLYRLAPDRRKGREAEIVAVRRRGEAA
jgi:single-stranded-DNA-specific exonuclease